MMKPTDEQVELATKVAEQAARCAATVAEVANREQVMAALQAFHDALPNETKHATFIMAAALLTSFQAHLMAEHQKWPYGLACSVIGAAISMLAQNAKVTIADDIFCAPPSADLH